MIRLECAAVSPAKGEVAQLFQRKFVASRAQVRDAHHRAEAAIQRATEIRQSLHAHRSSLGDEVQASRKTAALLQLTAEASACALREKDRFIALASHELRQPLNAALAAVRLGELDPSVVGRALGVVHRQLVHLTVVLDDLLEMSRLTLRTEDLRLEAVDLCELVLSSVESIEPTAVQKDIVVATEVPSGIIITVDRARLHQALVNLVSNAVRYTPAGGRVSVVGAAESETATVTVRDNGQGIERGHLSGIFEPFGRGGEHDGRGLGIGLALVKGIVELHGGSVSVASPGAGLGSAFTIRLPLVRRSPG